MKLDDEQERHQMLGLIRQRLSGAREVSDTDVLSQVGGYPGVLYHWYGTPKDHASDTWEQLVDVAQDAQAGRFPELEGILTLEPDALRLATRIALLPRIAAEQTLPALHHQPYASSGLSHLLRR